MPNAANISIHQIGKMAPYWVPDNMTVFCMQCNQKFSFIKRRHHCRACGLVLCSACCSLKAKLEYLGDVEARICVQCDIILNQNRDSNRVSNVSFLFIFLHSLLIFRLPSLIKRMVVVINQMTEQMEQMQHL